MYRGIKQVGSWKKLFNEKYNSNLTISDVHNIFEKYRVPFSYSERGGCQIKYYDTNSVEDLMYDGTIKREIEQITRGKQFANRLEKLPAGKSIPVPSNEPKKRNGRYVIVNNNQPKTIEDGADYKNGENDMETYSDYLINNVYQFENKIKNITKRIIKESELKQIVESCVRNILNELGKK